MLSEIDKQQINRLYKLLQDNEKSDPDTAAALRWAIFQLAFTPEPEINSIMDSGMFNEIVKGYAVLAMQSTGTERNNIQEAVDALDSIFDDTDAATARKAYREL